VSIVRLLEKSPAALHQEILDAASSRRLRYWISEESAVAEDEDEDDGPHGPARRRLAELLGEDIDRDVRVALGQADGWRGWWRETASDQRADRDGDDDHPEGRRARGHRHGPFTFVMSTRLEGDGWLNLETRLPPSGLRWKLPALTWLGLMALAISAVVVLMVRRITRPMASLAAAAERAGRGEMIEPLPEVGPLDVRQTTAAFNRMHDRQQRFMQDRTRMLAAMSHDLRTPITTLRLRAEFVEDDEIRSKILETLEEMQRMTEATLAFVREEAKAEATRQVDLNALIESVAADLSDLGSDVQFAETTRVTYACRPHGMRRALRNLLENAIRYGDKAEVALKEVGEQWLITIDDHGPGIPDDDIDRMFQPFVRLDESRSEETGGIGLGLAIARSIIRGHGGDIKLENREEGGLRATISLPRIGRSADRGADTTGMFF
jgi:signal transduction histidine kinase